jgi:hypothetical protein
LTDAELEPLGELTRELNRLHVDAGRPSLRQISADIERMEERAEQVSRDTIGAMLKGSRPPKWEKLRCVVTVLNEASFRHPDRDETVQRFHALWEVTQNGVRASDPETEANLPPEAPRTLDARVDAGEDFKDIVATLSFGDQSALLSTVLLTYAPKKTLAAVLLARPEVLGPLLLNMDDNSLRRSLIDCLSDADWERLLARPWSPSKLAQLLLAINPVTTPFGSRKINDFVLPMTPAFFVRILDTLDPQSAAEVLVAAEYPRLAEAADLMDLVRLAGLASAADNLNAPGRAIAAVLRESAKRFGVDLK